MSNNHNTVGVESRAQNSETPPTSGMVNGAKSNQTKRILTHARHFVCAIVLSPVYQTAIATVAAAGIVLLGGHHGF